MDKKAWILSKGYTDKSILGISGALAGKNCTIKSSEHKDGVTTIVFQWTADTGETRETQIEVFDGTPIYIYQAGERYKYGDLVIYQAQWYMCTAEHTAGPELDPSKFTEIGSADGNYDIINDSSELPPRFTSADRKMYFSIADGDFWLWDGEKWVLQNPRTISDDEIDALFA